VTGERDLSLPRADSDRGERLMWIAWVLIRLAGVALITGVLFYPQVDRDVLEYQSWAHLLYAGQLPWRGGFRVEYPPGVFPAMLLPGGLSVFELQFIGLALLADALVARSLWRNRPRGLGSWCWLLLPIALGPIMWVRFDVFVAAALVGFVACLRTNRWRAAGACLAVATLLKLWPIVILVVVWRLIPADGRRRVAGWAIGITTLATVPVLAWGGGSGLKWMLDFQGGRGLEIETIWAWPAVLAHSLNPSVQLVPGHGTTEVPIAGAVAIAMTLLLPALLAAVAAFTWFDPRKRFTIASATLLTVAVVLIASKSISAQYVVWAVAAVAIAIDEAPVGSRRRCWHLIAASTALAVTTQVLFPFLFLYAYLGWFRGDLAVTLHAEAALVWIGVVLNFTLRRPEQLLLPTTPEPRRAVALSP
jgi:hypothetical protein